MKNRKFTIATFGICALPLLVVMVASCGTSHLAIEKKSYGGSWSHATLNLASNTTFDTKPDGPGDSLPVIASENGSALKTNIGHIKNDLKHMTSREKLEGIKSEIPILNRNQTFEDSMALASQPQVNYLRNKNILIGGGLGILGILTLLAFPIFGFLALTLGVLFGIAGVYDVHHPNETE